MGDVPRSHKVRRGAYSIPKIDIFSIFVQAEATSLTHSDER